MFILLHKVVLTFERVDEILTFDQVKRSCDAIYCAVQRDLKCVCVWGGGGGWGGSLVTFLGNRTRFW